MGIVSIIRAHGTPTLLEEWFLQTASEVNILRLRTLIDAGFDVEPAKSGVCSALDLGIKAGHTAVAQLLTTHPLAIKPGLLCGRCSVDSVNGHLKVAARQEDAKYAT